MNAILWIEYKLYKELIETIDSKLFLTLKEINEVSDPDSFGYFDSAEHLTGLGFVILQTFLTSVYGVLEVEKKKAFLLGPKHTDGNSLAKIVNDVANYWKHNNEWSLDRSSKRRDLIEETFNSLGFPINTDYPLIGILSELSDPKHVSFIALFKKLELWQKNVEENKLKND